jgi:hypothetical protein
MASEVEIQFLAQVDAAKKSIDEINAKLGNTKSSTETAAGKMKALNDSFKTLTGVSLSGAAAIGVLVKGVQASIEAAKEAEMVMAQTEAVIKSTGQTAGYSAEGIAALALQESALTSIDDELVQSGLNVLLRFDKIGMETFPQAARAAENMAAAMAKGDPALVDMAGAASTLGKVLQDPVRYMSLLGRQGIIFSEESQDAIKAMWEMGDAAGAQALILEEFEKKFGGAAEAMGGTNVGKIEKAKNAFENLGEVLGNKLLPVMGDAAQAIADLVSWNDRLNASLQLHQEEVLHTSNSYEEYTREILRAYAASGKVPFINADTIMGMTDAELAALSQRIKDAAGVVTKAEWDKAHEIKAANDEAALSEEELALAAEESAARVDAAMSKLSFAMSGKVTKENEDYLETQANVTGKMEEDMAKIQELMSKTYLTGDQKQELADLKAEYAELATQYGENAEEHDAATKGILFNILQQQLAVDGLSEVEAGFLIDTAQKWGLVGQAEVEAYDKASEFASKAGIAIGTVNDLSDAIDQIHDKTVTLTINYEQTGSGSPILSEDPENAYLEYLNNKDINGNGIIGGAGGLDIIAPRGHPTDSYPIMVKEDEQVHVGPAGQTQDSLSEIKAELRNLPNAIAIAVRDGILLAGA